MDWLSILSSGAVAVVVSFLFNAVLPKWWEHHLRRNLTKHAEEVKHKLSIDLENAKHFISRRHVVYADLFKTIAETGREGIKPLCSLEWGNIKLAAELDKPKLTNFRDEWTKYRLYLSDSVEEEIQKIDAFFNKILNDLKEYSRHRNNSAPLPREFQEQLDALLKSLKAIMIKDISAK